MDLSSLIPDHYKEVLPVCPCGCKGELADENNPVPVEDYVYRIKERKNIANDSPLNIERLIIRQSKWYDSPLAHHMRHIRHLFPWVTHDPNLVRLVKETIDCETDKKKMMHMIGHASSGKTHFMVLDAFRMLDLWPTYSECFVASPYRSASEYLLWAAFNAVADMLKERGKRVNQRASVISFGANKKAGPGTITLVSFHSVGVLRGKKLVDQNKGRLGVFLDEAGEFTNDSILHIIANLKSQKGLRVRTGTNFRSITGLDGRFNQPESESWMQLSRELSYKWDSVGGARTVRLRAKVSPNLIIGQDYYPYLLKKDEHDDLLAYGEDSPFYLSQGDAFPSVKSVSRIVISEADIQGGSVYERVQFAQGTEEPFAFLDPSFTEHGDGSIICAATLGVEALTGLKKIRIDDLYENPINETTVWDDHYIRLAQSLRGPKGLKASYKEGELITPYDLNALMVADYLQKNQIPFNNFAFDDSLRGSTTASFLYFLGEGVESIYYGGKPTNKMTFPAEYKWGIKPGSKQRERQRMRSDELYTNIVSQMWLVTAEMIKAGYVRDAFVGQRAIDQLQLRLKMEPKTTASSIKKLGIESKKDYKERNRNESPDHADAMCGCVWLIVDRKLAPSPDASDASLRGGVSVVKNLMAKAANGELNRDSRFKTLSR